MIWNKYFIIMYTRIKEEWIRMKKEIGLSEHLIRKWFKDELEKNLVDNLEKKKKELVGVMRELMMLNSMEVTKM